MQSHATSGRTELTHVAVANQYARDVADGRVLACKWVKLACERHLRDLVAEKRKDFAYRFDAAKANRFCRVMEALPHTKGKWAIPGRGSVLIVLEPWQKFIFCSIFGWLRKGSGFRRFRTAYICVPRKNGKSLIGGGVGVYMLAADGEYGAEVYSGATTEKQAWEVFRPAKQMVERTKPIQKMWGVRVNAQSLVIPDNGSRFEPVIGKPGDGASPSCAIVDEYHEHDSDVLFDTMQTGMGAREQPLMLVITTAGSNLAGPCYSLQGDVQKVLEGSYVNEELFGVVYTVDPGVDWTSELALRMANPNFDVSIAADFLRSRQADAVANSRKQNVFKTKHLNIWVNASTAWMNMERWAACKDESLSVEEFRGEDCWSGIDLSSKIDLTSVVKVFKRLKKNAKDEMEEHYYFFGRHYLPEDRASEPEAQHYQSWVHNGQLKTTPGGQLDQRVILADLIEDSRLYNVKEFAWDRQFASTMQGALSDETGIVNVEIAQTAAGLSEAMKTLEALVKTGRAHHDGDPVLTWALSNVVAHENKNDQLFPNKERPENKIDPVSALLNGLERARLDDGIRHEFKGIEWF